MLRQAYGYYIAERKANTAVSFVATMEHQATRETHRDSCFESCQSTNELQSVSASIARRAETPIAICMLTTLTHDAMAQPLSATGCASSVRRS